MSHHMTSAVFQCFYAGGNTRLIALALADACADESGEGIYLSIDTVAQMAAVGRSTVKRAMAQLLAEGWVLREGGNTGGRGRTNTYNINPDWITAVAVERARARQAGQRAGKVMPPAPRAPADVTGCGTQKPGPVDKSIKGFNLNPFIKPKRGSNSALKGFKNDLKGFTHVNPEQEQNTLTPPLPPEPGGVRDLSEFQALESEYPRQDPADRKPAQRVWLQIAADARRLEAMRTVLRAQRDSPQWQADAGRWVPKLSRWLRGWLVGDGPPLPVVVPPVVVVPLPPPVVLSPEQIEANKARARAAREALGQLLAADRLQGPAKVPAKSRAGACS